MKLMRLHEKDETGVLTVATTINRAATSIIMDVYCAVRSIELG